MGHVSFREGNPFKTPYFLWGVGVFPLRGVGPEISHGMVAVVKLIILEGSDDTLSQRGIDQINPELCLGAIWSYLEDHPRTGKWLGSPPFTSHKKAIYTGNKPI